jgi:hypothetical protein
MSVNLRLFEIRILLKITTWEVTQLPVVLTTIKKTRSVKRILERILERILGQRTLTVFNGPS